VALHSRAGRSAERESPPDQLNDTSVEDRDGTSLTDREVDHDVDHEVHHDGADDVSDVPPVHDPTPPRAAEPVAEPATRSVAEPEAEPVTTAPPIEEPARPERVRAGRTSTLATIGLILGVCAVLTALSGRLAPVGIVLGAVGLLVAAAGMAATGRPRVTGKGVALLALVASLAGLALAILAVSHTTSWLDSSVDQVARARDWLDTQMSWLKGW
jgi:hypothetical protein